MSRYLLVITKDGYGKRVAVNEIRRTRRDAVGVKMSKVPVAFAEVVDDTNAELVLASLKGKIQRLRVGDIPTRRRIDRSSGRISKGARIMRLNSDDRVATGALVYPVEAAPKAVLAEIGIGGKGDTEDSEIAFITRLFEHCGGSLAWSAAVVLNRPELARLAPAKTEAGLDAWFGANPDVGSFALRRALIHGNRGLDGKGRRLWLLETKRGAPRA